jgi:hypothetical protein
MPFGRSLEELLLADPVLTSGGFARVKDGGICQRIIQGA